MRPGPAIQPDLSTPRLPLQLDADHYQVPVAAYGDWIVLSEPASRPVEHQIIKLELWNALTGERQPGWETPPDTQDGVWDHSGDWIVTVRTGLELPFPEWQLILRNLSTGETRVIARADPAVLTVPNVRVGLPSGYAPTPSMSGSRVVWPELVVDPDGTAKKQIEMYDLSDGQRSTLASVDAIAEDMWQPSVAGSEVAWVHRPASGPQELVVLDVLSSQKRTFPVGGAIYSCALSADGRNLAWDDDYTAKRVLDLSNGQVLQYAGDEGWGTQRSGNFVSWQPSTVSLTSGTKSSGAGGFYDFQHHQVRFVAPHVNSEIISANLFGDWFVWQDRSSAPWSSPPSAEGSFEPEGEYFYFLKLEQ